LAGSGAAYAFEGVAAAGFSAAFSGYFLAVVVVVAGFFFAAAAAPAFAAGFFPGIFSI